MTFSASSTIRGVPYIRVIREMSCKLRNAFCSALRDGYTAVAGSASKYSAFLKRSQIVRLPIHPPREVFDSGNVFARSLKPRALSSLSIQDLHDIKRSISVELSSSKSHLGRVRIVFRIPFATMAKNDGSLGHGIQHASYIHGFRLASSR